MASPSALAVYCGSRPGRDPRYRAQAVRFGRLMAEAGVSLVYGGGSVGIMGAVSDAVLQAGGKVVGVIPRFLQRAEVQHLALTEQHVVETMHERKLMMFERADGFVVLPGGIGTLEEFFEVLSWRGLELHDKPIVVVDGSGYWRPLRDLLLHSIEQGFAGPRYADFVHFAGDVDEVIPILSGLPRGGAKADLDDRV